MVSVRTAASDTLLDQFQGGLRAENHSERTVRTYSEAIT